MKKSILYGLLITLFCCCINFNIYAQDTEENEEQSNEQSDSPTNEGQSDEQSDSSTNEESDDVSFLSIDSFDDLPEQSSRSGVTRSGVQPGLKSVRATNASKELDDLLLIAKAAKTKAQRKAFINKVLDIQNKASKRTKDILSFLISQSPIELEKLKRKDIRYYTYIDLIQSIYGLTIQDYKKELPTLVAYLDAMIKKYPQNFYDLMMDYSANYEKKHCNQGGLSWGMASVDSDAVYLCDRWFLSGKACYIVVTVHEIAHLVGMIDLYTPGASKEDKLAGASNLSLLVYGLWTWDKYDGLCNCQNHY